MKSPKSSKITLLESLLNNRWPLIGEDVRREAFVKLIQDGSPAALEVLLKTDDSAILSATLKAYREGHPEDVKTHYLPGTLGTHQVVSMKTDHGVRLGDLPVPSRAAILADLDIYARQGWERLPSPEELVRTALKTGDLDQFKSSGADWIKLLLTACDDPDRKVRANLEKVLRGLESQEEHEVLCRELIERDIPLARAVVVKEGFAPEEAAARALFFFLTDQWERYEALDFDRRLLRVAYAAEDADMRRRIREKLRAIGRPELLTVVTGHDAARRIVEMSPDELEFAVGMLQASRDWRRLWEMIFETSLPWSARILKMLASAGWQPPEAEREVFVALQELLGAGLLLDSDAFARELPRVLLQAQLRAPGRINDVAFSPTAPWLAIATGARKLVLWNYAAARTESVLGGFAHSVGRVAFTASGKLVCAERDSATQASAGVYGWAGNGLFKLGEHQGAITALAALEGDLALSAGRDAAVVVWDVAARAERTRRVMAEWPRAVCASREGDAVLALLRRNFYRLTAPALESGSWFQVGPTPSCAAFLPGSSRAVIGRNNGQVRLYKTQFPFGIPQREAFATQHAQAVVGIAVLPERGYILTAGREGEVRFFDMTSHESLAQVSIPGGEVTALHVSPDGAFMAVGGADASFSLWDLRMPDVAALLRTPLAQIPSSAVGVLDACAHSPTLSVEARRAVQFVAALVRHRARFDIELESGVTHTIMAGEFDIEIE